MQVDTNWYWNKHPQQHVITVPTRKILHPQLEVNALTGFHEITKRVCNRTQTNKSISRHPICLTDSAIFLTDSNYYYILEEIGRREKIKFERYVEVYSDDEES